MERYISDTLALSMGIGKLLLENGAETYRVEDTVYRVAQSYGYLNIHVYCVPNTIILNVETAEGDVYNRLWRVPTRDTNLGKVKEANELSRQITAGNLTVTEARAQLKIITNQKRIYQPYERYLAGAILSGFFALMFLGTWIDLIGAVVAGGLGYIFFKQINDLTNLQFFSELTSSFIIGWLVVLLVTVGIGDNMDIMILASVMTLVPGRAITNGIRDLMAGDYVSGLSILADAFLTASAIGIGVAGVLAIV
ncbi:threonine/serine exporter family protein [Atopococcus tabaci]|uniref:threonine/serine exporter family protein n=1 Tax=Atopococcus tabaci TaxID=269774 RepID=UPI00240A9B37|nr:threonine/serine exporter family protein [Atopococcus tabaci]